METAPLNVAQVLDTKVAVRVYADALSPAAREIGGLGADLCKTLRLFAAPLQLLAALQDRLRSFCDQVRSQVPEERQTEAPAHVAGPILENMRFTEDSSPLRTLYVNLLAKAIDRENQKQAHPAFIKVIEHLSPAEVRFLDAFKDHRLHQIVCRGENMRGPSGLIAMELTNLPALHGEDPDDIEGYIGHLHTLGLMSVVTAPPGTLDKVGHTHSLILDTFGRRFLRACFAGADAGEDEAAD